MRPEFSPLVVASCPTQASTTLPPTSQPSPRYKEASSVSERCTGVRLKGRAPQGGSSYLSSSSSSSWAFKKGC
jgi:hypothetical protein